VPPAVKILWRRMSLCSAGGYPVLPDRAPSFTKAFFVCIPVLRNDRCNPVGMGHRQAEAGGRAIIEHIDCVSVDFECLREGLHRESQSIERIRILAFRRDLSESETGKVWRDHAVIVR